MPSNPRNKNGGARRGLRARLAAEGRPCWICVRAGRTGTIDYSLRFPHPYSFVADEKVPVSKYWLGGYPTPEAAALDYSNLLAAHKCCNEWRSNKTYEDTCAAIDALARKGRASTTRTPQVVRPSRDWRHPRREADDEPRKAD